MSDLLNQYFLALEGLGLSDADLDLEKKRKSVLEKKMLMHFGDKLKTFIHPIIGVGKIVFKSTVSMDEALSTKFDAVKIIPVKIQDAAFILRSVILKPPRKTIPSKLVVKEIIEGEVQIPQLVQEFFLMPHKRSKHKSNNNMCP